MTKKKTEGKLSPGEPEGKKMEKRSGGAQKREEIRKKGSASCGGRRGDQVETELNVGEGATSEGTKGGFCSSTKRGAKEKKKEELFQDEGEINASKVADAGGGGREIATREKHNTEMGIGKNQQQNQHKLIVIVRDGRPLIYKFRSRPF